MRHGPFVQQRGQPRLHFVQVADRMLVEDHEIGLEALEPPVFLRFERLAHDREVVVDDAHEQDRQDRRRCRAPTGCSGPSSLAASTSAAARNEPSVPITREASRSNSTASSFEMFM